MRYLLITRHYTSWLGKMKLYGVDHEEFISRSLIESALLQRYPTHKRRRVKQAVHYTRGESKDIIQLYRMEPIIL